MKSKSNLQPRKRLLSLAILAALGGGALSGSPAAQAATVTWNCVWNYWYVTGCWSPVGMPTVNDDVIVGPVRTNWTVVRFDGLPSVYPPFTSWVNSLLINSGTGYGIELRQTGGNLTVTADEIIGSSGTGAFTQSGGTNTVNHLYFGAGSSGNGSYNLSDTGRLSVTGNEYVGLSGGGAFTQSGGRHTVNNTLSLGYYSTSTGTYDLSGTGSLSVTGDEHIGLSGGGTFTQSGGTHAVIGGVLKLGTNSGSNGSYSLSGTGSLSAGVQVIGRLGTGTFSQNGGTNTVSDNLTLGDYTTSTGTYNLSGGSLWAGLENIGYLGTGIFTQSGGTNTVSREFHLGYYGNGTYNLSGTGSLSAVSEYIGNSGTGTFTQDGATNTVSSALYLGANSGGNGTYDLSGTGSLSARSEYIGNSGTGAFTQSGGTNTVSQVLYLGTNIRGNGTYNLSGTGSLSVGTEYIGYVGTGIFTQSGGTHTVSSALYLGANSGGNGTYDLSGTGSLSVVSEYIGYVGHGTFTQSGGTHKVSTDLYLGFGSGGSGTYALNGGTLNVGGVTTLNGVSTLALNGGSFSTGSLANQGNIAVSRTTDLIGDVKNGDTGRIVVSDGATATFRGDVVHNGSEIRVDSGSQAVFFGAVSGAGAYTGSGTVVFEGDLSPGNSPARVSIAGDMALGMLSRTTLELGGLLRGSEYDAFDVGGTLSLNGALHVSLYDLGGGVFAPQAGDSFDLFTAFNLQGRFESLSYAALLDPSLTWQISYLIDADGTTDIVRLSVVPEPAAAWLFGWGLLGLVGVVRRRPPASSTPTSNAA